MELGERKQKILTAIIDSYIQTGEPVGSKALVEMLGNAVSSATIRNEMAELASWGYLEQPHTSAGRIPTAKAFRLYIDHLMRRQALSDEDQKDIDDMLAGSAGDPERLIGEASQALAESTGCAAVSTTPSEQNPRRSRTRRPDIRRPLWSRSGSWTRAAGKSRPRRKRKRRHASLVRRPRRTTGSNESGHKKPPGREAGWLFHRSYLSP